MTPRHSGAGGQAAVAAVAVALLCAACATTAPPAPARTRPPPPKVTRLDMPPAQQDGDTVAVTGQASLLPLNPGCIRLDTDAGIPLLIGGPAAEAVATAVHGKQRRPLLVALTGRIGAETPLPANCRIGRTFLADSLAFVESG